MDTKLKNYDEGSGTNEAVATDRNPQLKTNAGIYGFCWVGCVISTVLTGICGSILAAFSTIYSYSVYPEGTVGYFDESGQWISWETKWEGALFPPDGSNMKEAMLYTGVVFVVLMLAALAFLIAMMVQTGRVGKNREDGIRLNWFDRIWSEVHLAIGFTTGTFFCLLLTMIYEIWPCENWFGLFESKYSDTEYFGIPNNWVIGFVCIGLITFAFMTWACLISLVKKLKARQFWEKSLLGGIWLWFYRTIKNSDRMTLKVICGCLGLCFLASFWDWTGYWWGPQAVIFPLIAVGLILAVVPKQTAKLKAIRNGVAQVRRGNLSYKIPVDQGRGGAMGVFDKLAEDINGISEAQSIAVQNELKTQRMKTDLISNVSHDLKTPLTSMAAYIDLLKQEGLDSPNAPEYLDIIDSKTQRLKALTENLFEAAKASSGAIPVNMSDIDLLALVNQSLAEMEGKLANRNLSVIVKNQCGDEFHVMADGQLLWRVIENLLGNVSKYALDSSRVYINISRLTSKRPNRANRILLEVKNISKEQLNISADELMERFKRGDESRNTEGSGLGLAIAKDLMHLMHGDFEIAVDGDLFKACAVLDEAGEKADAERDNGGRRETMWEEPSWETSSDSDDMTAENTVRPKEKFPEKAKRMGSSIKESIDHMLHSGF